MWFSILPLRSVLKLIFTCIFIRLEDFEEITERSERISFCLIFDTVEKMVPDGVRVEISNTLGSISCQLVPLDAAGEELWLDFVASLL